MPFTELEIEAINKLRGHLLSDSHYRNEVAKRCPVCNSNVEDRVISLYKELIEALYRVYCYCGEKRIHEFDIKDVKDFLGKNEYARFGDLVRFGGLVYKPKDDNDKSRKGLFGLNMERCKEFFHGTREIPLYITVNQITGEIIDSKYVKVNHFPKLISFLKDNGLYDHERLF